MNDEHLRRVQWRTLARQLIGAQLIFVVAQVVCSSLGMDVVAWAALMLNLFCCGTILVGRPR